MSTFFSNLHALWFHLIYLLMIKSFHWATKDKILTVHFRCTRAIIFLIFRNFERVKREDCNIHSYFIFHIICNIGDSFAMWKIHILLRNFTILCNVQVLVSDFSTKIENECFLRSPRLTFLVTAEGTALVNGLILGFNFIRFSMSGGSWLTWHGVLLVKYLFMKLSFHWRLQSTLRGALNTLVSLSLGTGGIFGL